MTAVVQSSPDSLSAFFHNWDSSYPLTVVALIGRVMHEERMKMKEGFQNIIIKITISSIVIGLKNSYFPLIHLASCYRTVCYRTVQQTNHIQSCSLNQPITFIVVV